MANNSPIYCALALLIAAVPISASPAPRQDGALETSELEAEADDLWMQRADGSTTGGASPTVARHLVEAHERALASDPQNLRLRWKLLRALHFQGDFAMHEQERRLQLFESARAIADASRAILSARVGEQLDEMRPEEIAEEVSGIPHAIDLYFFSAIHWGLWGETTGKMKAARQGVGGKIRDFAQVVILLDEEYEAAAGHRFLGRLHSQAPKVPFFTGWIDRDLAIRELERATRLAPDEPFNLLFLADALLRFDHARRDEALSILRELTATPPRPERLVEDSASIRDARQLLGAVDD